MKTEEIILGITSDFNNSSNDNELRSVIAKHIRNFGGKNFFFGATLYHNLKAHPDTYILNNYPREWRERHENDIRFENVMSVEHCLEKSTPIEWPTKQSKSFSSANRKFFSEASEFGINSGISFPYRSMTNEYGALAVSVSDNYKESDLSNPKNLFGLQVLGATLFDFYKLKTKKENTKVLTNREKECLQWVAVGKTSWEIAIIIGVTERTVGFHIQNATTKMNTVSRTNAAIIAILNGEITT